MATKNLIPGARVKVGMHGLGTIERIGDVENYPASATATVQFDSGKRYVTYAKRLKSV